MSNIKEREREELHKTIWKIANELRGSVDGWDFKQYVLGLLFYRFISENIENYVNDNQRKAGLSDFSYRNISDEEALLGKSQILEEKGFFILPSELFCNIRKGADKNENLNVVISNVFNNIEASARGTASEDDVKGLFDDFTIDNKLGNTVDERNEKLVKLLNAIGDLNFGEYTDNNIDLFGDAYEFLMTMYASSAGKSGGEFFTPQEVGELLARIVIMDKKEVNKVYDPACGSGGLLLKFAKILGKENLEFMAGVYQIKDKEKINELIKIFKLDEVLNKRAKTLSGGWQRRLSIAISLINDPKILFLDEPTLGLDVIARKELWKIINSLKGKITIILTTHYMEEAESLSDRIGIMANGELIDVGTSEYFIKKTKAKNFEDAFVSIVTGGEV